MSATRQQETAETIEIFGPDRLGAAGHAGSGVRDAGDGGRVFCCANCAVAFTPIRTS